MALAEGMKNLVNSLKATKRSRKAFVEGNIAMTKALRAENQNYLANVHKQNQALREQTKQFVKASREERRQSFKQTMDKVHKDLDRVHQAVGAIRGGAREMLREFKEDSALAHKYWQSISTGEEIPESRTAESSSDAEVSKENSSQSDEKQEAKDKNSIDTKKAQSTSARSNFVIENTSTDKSRQVAKVEVKEK